MRLRNLFCRRKSGIIGFASLPLSPPYNEKRAKKHDYRSEYPRQQQECVPHQPYQRPLRSPSRGTEDTDSSSCSISFSDMIEIWEVSPISSLTDHPEELFYQPHEYTIMRATIRRVLRDRVDTKYQQQELQNECQQPQLDAQTQPTHKKKVSSRVLESQLVGQSAQKYAAWRCILFEQELQRKRCECDGERMAMAYKKVTNASVLQAQARALNDAEAVAAYLGR